MLELLSSARCRHTSSFRIGITGPPGVGKSTFIETFGTHIADAGHRIGVLAIDPTSHITGGSILGDKTRMMALSNDERAFVRPSPSACTLGGVRPDTAASIQILEAAGYDVVIVETVGVGQNEIIVNELVDMFMLLLAPANGDDLQGIKKGVVEMSDIVLINKCDGDLVASAQRTLSDYRNALHITTPKWSAWTPQVRTRVRMCMCHVSCVCVCVTAHVCLHAYTPAFGWQSIAWHRLAFAVSCI